MFLQVCEWLGKLPGLLMEGGALRAANKRRRIGQGLVELHQGLSRLSENAASIEHLITNIAQSSSDERIWRVPHLKQAIAGQRLELEHTSNLLWRHRPFLEYMVTCFGITSRRSLS